MTITSPTESENFVAGDYLVCMRDFALSKHISANTLLKNSHQDIQFLLNPPKKVNEQTMSIISSNLFNAAENPLAACIEFGRSMTMTSHGNLGLAIQGCNQLKEVANLTQQYFKTRASARMISFLSEKKHTFLRFSDHEPFNASKVVIDTRFFTSLSTLINIEGLVRELLSHHPIDETCIIQLQREKPDNFPDDLLPDNLVFEFESEHFQLAIPNHWMQLTLKQGDLELAAMATNECEIILKQLSPKDLIDQVYKVLDQTKNRNISLQAMAKHLCMSVSTLQRRLKELDTTYQNIKSNARINQAKALLRHTDQTLDVIADALGYSDASNFTKSFKTQAGLTPKNYRLRSRH